MEVIVIGLFVIFAFVGRVDSRDENEEERMPIDTQGQGTRIFRWMGKGDELAVRLVMRIYNYLHLPPSIPYQHPARSGNGLVRRLLPLLLRNCLQNHWLW
jgi:hypothetical protein